MARVAATEDVRGRVLTAAIRLIEKDGLAGLSMREVARAAGVSHQAPYHYFDDRESILAAIAEEGFNILADRMEKSADPKERPAQRLATLGRVYVEFACDHPAMFRVMFRPDFVDLERFPTVRSCGDRAFDLVPPAVQAVIDDGLPANPSAQALVFLGWSTAHGLACLLLDGPLERKIPDIAQHRDAIIRDVMDALRAVMETASIPKAATPDAPKRAAKAPSRRKAR